MKLSSRMVQLGISLWVLCQPLAALEVETAFNRYYAASEIRPLSTLAGQSLQQQGFRTVVPSDPIHPAGQYFIVGLADKGQAGPASVELSYYRTDSKDLRSHVWSLEDVTMKKWLYLGLTGEDWPDADLQPLAWRLLLLDQEGKVLDEWKSFLWEMP